MQTLPITLPTSPAPTPATLYFEHTYSQGNHFLDFLHIIRQLPIYFALGNPDALEEDYWSTLNNVRDQFADNCAAAIGNVDLLVDPPSNRGYHRPYLSAFKQRYPNVGWVMFTKTGAVTADINDIDALRKATTLRGAKPKGAMPQVSHTHDILIIDDVYATGTTAAVVAELLTKPNSPPDLRFHVAAPLRIPPELMKNPTIS